ncbi:sodium- and chloride-dependent glycine transporter 2-like [Pecten maximus]|uniref:sodium- and chloride-dependent glycine transporter 2-like n=1 Tax=Pecten maximus TaxID=6579 RepID=UPI001458FC05|nr:sodium- and chloride-dependent glycine transporter 2-like [Pecten maximus]
MKETSAVNVKWTSHVEFVVALLGYSIGLPEFWRVPYLTYRNGGGPFIIAYILLMLVCGLPLYFLELALSQYSGKGPWRFWDICPLLRGIGIAIAVINAISAINTAILEAWALEYFVNSFKSVLPWTNCDNDWNTLACYREGSNKLLWNMSMYNSSVYNHSIANVTITPGTNHSVDSVDEFWLYRILRISDGINDIGAISAIFVVYLFGMRLVAAISIVKSVESMGKVLYVTALLPVALVLIIWVRALTLTGATKGIMYFLSADFRRWFFHRIHRLSQSPELFPLTTTLAILTEPFLMILEEMFPKALNNRRIPLLAAVSVGMFLVGLPYATQAGVYIFLLVDWYTGTWSVMLMCMAECIVFAWIYGTHRIDRDVRLMLNRPLPTIVRISTAFIMPVFLTRIKHLARHTLQWIPANEKAEEIYRDSERSAEFTWKQLFWFNLTGQGGIVINDCGDSVQML